MKDGNDKKNKFVICINNSEPELQKFKIYQVIEEHTEDNNFIRVIDDSGEDYLYPVEYFNAINLPQKVEMMFSYS